MTQSFLFSRLGPLQSLFIKSNKAFVIQMPIHSKTHKGIFKLSDSQQHYIQSLLPKNYTLLSNKLAPQEIPNHEMPDFCNSNGLDKRLTRSDSAERRQEEVVLQRNARQLQAKKQELKSQNNGVFISKALKGNQKLKMNKKKSEIIKSKRTKKLNDNIYDQSSHFSEHESFREKIEFKKQESFPKVQPRQEADQSIEYTGSAETTHHLSTPQKQFCRKFLHQLKKSRWSCPFKLPVDPIGQGVPNYLFIIKQPMDLKTIEKKLENDKYAHNAEFHADINKIFLNSYKFNSKQTSYFDETFFFEEEYHKLLKEVEINPQILNKADEDQNKQLEDEFDDQEYLGSKKSVKNIKMKMNRKKRNSKKNNDENQEKFQAMLPSKKQYSKEQRQVLCQKFHSLTQEDVDYLFKMIISQHHQAFFQNQEQVRIDFELMGQDCLQNIQRFFKNIQESSYYGHTFPLYDN